MPTDGGRGSAVDRFLVGGIVAVLFLIGGLVFGTFMAGYGAAAKPEAEAGKAGEGGTQTPDQPAAAAVEHACVIVLVNHAHDAVRSDLIGAAVLDVAGGKELIAELDSARSVRFTCPAQAAALDVAVRTEDGGLFVYREVAVDPALAYFELEAEAGGESTADVFLARRGEAGIEAAVPDWLTAEVGSEPDAGETAGEAAEPDAPAEPLPMKGDIYVEVRDIVGDARAKADIREIAKRGGGGIEACVQQHAPDQPRTIHNVQLAIGPNGKSTNSLLLQGANIPELDACVEAVIAGWDYGEAEQPSFFKVKTVWSAP